MSNEEFEDFARNYLDASCQSIELESLLVKTKRSQIYITKDFEGKGIIVKFGEIQ